MSIYVSLIDGMGSATDSVSGTVTTAGADAEDFMHVINDFMRNGGVVDTTEDDFLVAEHSPNNKTVDITKGIAYVLNASYARSTGVPYAYRVYSTATETVTIADNTSGNPRIDLLVLKVDQSVSPNDEATNVATLTTVQGTPAASPTVPSVPSDGNDYLVLAHIAVANGFTTITNSDITDKRINISFADRTGGWEFAATSASVASDANGLDFIELSGDYTDIIEAGMRLRLYEDNVLKYFIVHTVGSFSGGVTPIGMWGGTDYTLGTGTVRDVYISREKNPFGFGSSPTKWRVTTSQGTNYSVTSSGYTEFNSSTRTTVPRGIWKLGWKAAGGLRVAAGVDAEGSIALSTSATAASDDELIIYFRLTGATAEQRQYSTSQLEMIKVLSDETTFYTVGKIDTGSATFLLGGESTTEIYAYDAYL